MDDNMAVVPDNLADLTDYIEELFEKGEKIDGRKKKERDEWKISINFAVEKLNKLRGFKVYKLC